MKYIKCKNKETGEEIHVSKNSDGTFTHYGNMNLHYDASELEFPKAKKVETEKPEKPEVKEPEAKDDKKSDKPKDKK